MQWLKNLFKRCFTPNEVVLQESGKLREREQQAKEDVYTLRPVHLSMEAQRRHGSNSNIAHSRGIGGQVNDPQRFTQSAATRQTATTEKYIDTENFPVSMVVAAETGSAALGYLAGGSLAGAVVGSALNTDHQPKSDTSEIDMGCRASWSSNADGNSTSSSESSSIADTSSWD